MITNENWIDFIVQFFGIRDKEWLHHVLSNWSYLNNMPGCDCKFLYGIVPCSSYLEVSEGRSATSMVQDG